MRGLVILAVAVLLLAGCLAGEDGRDDEDETPSLPTLLAVGPFDVSTDTRGAEPVIAVAPDGTLYAEGVGGDGNRVWRSDDGGRNWTDISPPATGNASTNDGFLEVGPRGEVFASNVFELTFQAFRSTDRGESWVPLNVPRIPALMHRHWITALDGGVVHVTVEALDPGAAPLLLGLDAPTEGAVDTRNKGMYYTRSEDNGDTWSVPLRIDAQINYAGQSNQAVTPDGRGLYVVRYEEPGRAPLSYTYEDGDYYLLASEDGGDSWERREMFALNGTIGSALTSLAVNAEGVLAFAWSEVREGRSVTHLALSRDRGATWSREALGLSAGTHAMPFIAPYADGSWALLWYDSEARGATGQVDAPWFMRFARVRTDSSPASFELVPVPGVVHEGSICVKGPACGAEGGDRRLLDYAWIDLDAEQNAHLVFGSTNWGNPGAKPVYARVERAA